MAWFGVAKLFSFDLRVLVDRLFHHERYAQEDLSDLHRYTIGDFVSLDFSSF